METVYNSLWRDAGNFLLSSSHQTTAKLLEMFSLAEIIWIWWNSTAAVVIRAGWLQGIEFTQLVCLISIILSRTWLFLTYSRLMKLVQTFNLFSRLRSASNLESFGTKQLRLCMIVSGRARIFNFFMFYSGLENLSKIFFFSTWNLFFIKHFNFINSIIFMCFSHTTIF